MKKSHIIPCVKSAILEPIAHKYTGELGKAIDEINARYSMLMMGGKHKVYDHVEQRVSEPESVRVYESTQIFHDSKMVNPASFWVNDKYARRNFDNAVFKPYRTNNQINPKHFNHWQGWNVSYIDDMPQKEIEEYVQPWLEHIHNVFCSGNKEQSDYFIHWLAHLVQRPDDKPGVAIVLQSGQGFGKGIFVTLLSNIIGRRYVSRITDAHQVAGGFSGQMKDKMLINFDEATWGGDKKANGRLKALVTEIHLTIEEKHQNAEDIDHYARFLITSNNDYPVPIEHDDRRFFVPDVTTEKPDALYFERLGQLLTNEYAISCFFTYLQDVDLSMVNVRHFPNSATRQKIKAESIIHNDVYKSFLLAAYNEEIGAAEIMAKDIKASLLYEIFSQWKAKNTFKNATISSIAFGKAMIDAGFERVKRKDGTYYDITRTDIEKYLKSIGVI